MRYYLNGVCNSGFPNCVAIELFTSIIVVRLQCFNIMQELLEMVLSPRIQIHRIKIKKTSYIAQHCFQARLLQPYNFYLYSDDLYTTFRYGNE